MIENFFLRYAYPCAYIIMQRKEISPEELEDIAINNREISKERLEKVFHRAFDFIDQLAEKKNKERWDHEIIKEYFYTYHNEVIDKGEGIYATAPKMLKELSRVEKAKVIDKKDDVLSVEYRDKKGKLKSRSVLNHFVPEVKINNIVTIHYGYAVEIVN